MKVYQYGLLSPVANADLVFDQMRKANRYRNDLTQIEIGVRNERRRMLSEQLAGAPEQAAFDAANARLEWLVAEKKAKNAEARARVSSPEFKAAIKAARVERKVAYKALVVARKGARSAIADETAKVFEVQHSVARDARALIGESAPADKRLFWGTYQLVEMAAKDSAKLPLYDEGEPNDPRFRRFDGSGRVGVQIQKRKSYGGLSGMPVGQLFGSDPSIRVDPVATWCKKNRHGEDRRKLPLLHMRVDSNGRDPVWASWPIIMHRPLPEGGVIKRAAVSCRKYGPRTEWTVEISIDDSACAQQGPTGSGAVAVHLGWKLLDDGSLRVATWMSATGETGSLDLPAKIVGGFYQVDQLSSTRKTNMNAARDSLEVWLAANDHPEWLSEATKTLASWKSPRRLGHLARRWAANRFDGDASGFDPLEAWRYNDHHLWAWETSPGNARARREAYRVFAANLRRRFGVLVVDDAVYADVARRPKVEEDGEAKRVRRLRGIASPGLLRQTLCLAFGADATHKVEAAGVTNTCPACGSSDPAQVLKDARVTACVACSYHRDVDTTALLNALARAGHGKEVALILERGREVGRRIRGEQIEGGNYVCCS